MRVLAQVVSIWHLPRRKCGAAAARRHEEHEIRLPTWWQVQNEALCGRYYNFAHDGAYLAGHILVITVVPIGKRTDACSGNHNEELPR